MTLKILSGCLIGSRAPSPTSSTADLDKPSAGRHHHKHSSRRCADQLSPSPSTGCSPIDVARVIVGSVDCQRHNWLHRLGAVTGDIQSYSLCAPRQGNNFNVLVPFEVTPTSPWFAVLTRVLAVSNIKTPKDTVCPLGPYIWYPPVYVRTADGTWIARLPTGVCGKVRPVVSSALFHLVRTRNG